MVAETQRGDATRSHNSRQRASPQNQLFAKGSSEARWRLPHLPRPVFLGTGEDFTTSYQIMQSVRFGWWLPKFKRRGLGWVVVKIGLVLSLKHSVLGEVSIFIFTSLNEG